MLFVLAIGSNWHLESDFVLTGASVLDVCMARGWEVGAGMLHTCVSVHTILVKSCTHLLPLLTSALLLLQVVQCGSEIRSLSKFHQQTDWLTCTGGQVQQKEAVTSAISNGAKEGVAVIKAVKILALPRGSDPCQDLFGGFDIVNWGQPKVIKASEMLVAPRISEYFLKSLKF